MNDFPPILLTSSVIAMDQSVCLKSPDSRIFHTIEAIDKWLSIYPQGKYILCDGSGFDFSNLIQNRFPGANIECLCFINSEQLVREYGKGYGEGEIILHALNHSKFLNESEWFVKCTAKLWVKNFSSCINNWNEKILCHAFFSNIYSFKKVNIEYIDTRFYVVDKKFYLENLSHIHNHIDRDQGVGIEEKFLCTVSCLGLQKILFSVPPIVCGVGGGSGKYYKNSRIRQLKDLLRCKLASRLEDYKKLFTLE